MDVIIYVANCTTLLNRRMEGEHKMTFVKQGFFCWNLFENTVSEMPVFIGLLKKHEVNIVDLWL